MARNRYLCKKVEEGEIDRLDPLETQARITLLSQAPNIITSAISKGWISYPTKTKVQDDNSESMTWLLRYDCERAYHNRQKGMSYRDIAKMLGVGLSRVTHILHRGESIVLERKLNDIGVKPISVPDKATVKKHTSTSKSSINKRKRL